MSKFMKKVLTVTLTAVLGATMLSGCGSKNDTNEKPTQAPTTEAKDSGGSSNTEDTNTGENTADAKETSSLPETLGNPNITILWHTSEEQYLANMQENPKAFDAVWSVKSAFESKYGGKVTVESVDWGMQKEQLISKVNGGEVVDLAQANDQNFPIYPAKNIVQDISNYVDVEDGFWYPSITNAFAFGGKSYAVGTDATPVVIYYNKTLFHNYGEKTPREYFEAGEWTWENFRNAALAMTGDTDGDSINDTFGYGWWDLYVQFFATNGITHIAYNADGTITSNFKTKQAEEAITFLQNAFVKDKYIDVTQTGDSFINMFKSGKLAMTSEYGFGGYSAYSCDYEIEWAPMPTGPSGSKYQGGGGLSGWCIPITAANGEGAAAFMRMSSEMQAEHNNSANVEKYGADDVELMSLLADNIIFAPIGIEKYWDANWTVLEGQKQGTPVSTFLTTADEQIREGAAITLEQ